MNEKQFSEFVIAGAQALRYPATPDLSAAFLRSSRAQSRPSRNLAWALAIVLVAAASLLSVPEVRARILEFLQIGGVRILLPQVTEDQEIATNEQETKVPLTATPFPIGILTSVLELDGETTLEAARAETDFLFDLPTYPADLGDPDKVFLQEVESGKFVVLAWLDKQDHVELVLYVIGEGVTLEKGQPDVIEATQVDGVLALWVTGEYLLSVEGYQQPAKFVDGPVLIWVQDGITYRLEADLTMEEMIRIAESIN